MIAGASRSTPVFGLLFLEGTSPDGEPIITIAGETRERVQGFEDSVEKEVLERFHLESYRADHVLRFGTVPFDGVERGGEPPDFEVTSSSGPVALDCAAFADERNRRSYPLMEHLCERIISNAAGRDFTGIDGCEVSVWFGPQLADLPPRRSDDSVVEPLLEALAAAEIDREELTRTLDELSRNGGMPQVLPPVVATGRLADGSAGFVANVVSAAGARFPSGLPFEIKLSRGMPITMQSATEMLSGVVSSHDQPAIEHLLLTAGGPDASGFRYPSEEAIAAFLMKYSPQLEIQVTHLKAVTLHLWSSRTIVSIPLTRH